MSSSPSARQARPTRTRTRAASYGASSSCHAVHAWRSVSQRGSGVALGEQHGPGGPGRDRLQQRRVELGGDLRQLVGGGAGRADVVGGEHDLDVRGQHPGPGDAVLRLVQHAADRRRGGRDLALGQPQQGQTGLRLCPHWLAWR